MARRSLVVIGASAGGVEALRSLVSLLPHDFPAAVVVVVHTPAAGAMALARILDRSGPLPATRAEKDTALVPGRILVAPGGHHLVVEDHTARLSQGPRENGYRPSVDVTFRTAAKTLGNQVVAMVLSGSLDDGAAGAVAVKQRGGVVIVQSPDEAMHAGMPNAALAATAVDQVLELAAMPAALAGLLAEDVDAAYPLASQLPRKEAAVDALDAEALLGADHPGSRRAGPVRTATGPSSRSGDRARRGGETGEEARAGRRAVRQSPS